MPKDTYPHDYYKHPNGLPHLHMNSHAHFIEDGLLGTDYDKPLPIISTIGVGPRGNGVYAKVLQNDKRGFVYGIYDEETDEQLFQTPNIGAPHITVDTPDHKVVPGEITHVYFNVTQGNMQYTYDVEIPPGEIGSRIYLYDGTLEETLDGTYSVKESELRFYGKNTWQFHHSTHEDEECRWVVGNKPPVRTNDIVILKVNRKGAPALTFGTVEAVEPINADFSDPLVVMTCRTFIDIPLPSIGKNGHWYVDDVDTGVKAQGAKGEKGDQGERGPEGPRGPRGERGYQGERGLSGKDGRDAKIEIGNVNTVENGIGASVSSSYDSSTNVTTLNFAIPEGSPGRAIEIQSGIWYTDTLPPFDDTPINYAYIVYDGDRQFDLYIRGRQPIFAEDGGPWTVVEDWQGRPGTGLRTLLDPYYLDEEIGTITYIPASEGNIAFAPSEYISDDDVVIDMNGIVGIIGSSEDNSGFYEIRTIGKLNVNISLDPNSPLEFIKWDQIKDKPFESLGDSLVLDEENNLQINNEWFTNQVNDSINTKAIGAEEVQNLIKEITNE